MSGELKLRRGTTLQHSNFTGAEGEVTIDSDKDVPVVHDGATQGGFPLAKAFQLDDITSLSSLNTAALVEGQQFYRGEFWPGTGVGAVNIKWKADEPVANHNGGTIIDPAKISELDTVNKTFGTYFTPDTVSGNTGCFVVSEAFITLAQFGVLLDETPCADAVIAAFKAACSAKKPIKEWASGVVGLDKTVLWEVSGDFYFEATKALRFKALSGFPIDNKLFLPQNGTAKVPFSWVGATLDGRLMPARVSGAPDLLYISGQNISPAVVAMGKYICNDDRSGTAGDSCLFMAEGEDYLIHANEFVGAVDAGIYLSGDATGSFGKNAVISKNKFRECTVAAISKRLFQEHYLEGNNIEDSGIGLVVGGEADGVLPGKGAVLQGNTITRVIRPIELRNSDNSVVLANRITDYGVDSGGAAVAGKAVWLRGSSNCIVSNNPITQESVTTISGQYGVYVSSWTFEATTYPANHNLVGQNSILGSHTPIYEESNGCSNNRALYNIVNGATVATTMQGAGSFSVGIDSSSDSIRNLFGESGATALSTAKEVWEHSASLNLHFLSPSDTEFNLLVGNENNNLVARQTYNHTFGTWQWRAGGGSVVFQVGADGPLVPSYTVAGLPAGSESMVAYASDGRKNGEGVGAGTGVQVFYDGTSWIAVDTGQTVAA